MTKTTHTPGPWAIQYIECDTDGQPYYIHQREDQGARICDIRGWGHLTGRGGNALALNSDDAINIQRANAYLIAAAPNLLEALEQAIMWDGCDDYHTPAVWLKEARLAIAKAKGETA